MSSAIFYNLFCKGVGTSSSWASLDLIIPIQESYPTTIIIIKPYPVITVVPDNIIGLGIVWLWD